MNQPKQIVDGKPFSKFASANPHIWPDLVGMEVINSDRGNGYIVSIEERPDYIPLITIKFHDEDETVTFNTNSFRLGKTSLLLGPLLAQQVAEWLTVEAELNAKRIVLEHAKRQTIEYFRSLTTKYNVPPHKVWEGGSISPLGVILEKLESNEQIGDHEIAWLQGLELHRLIATIYHRNFKRSRDAWDLIKACKYFRKARLPQKAISASNGISSTDIQDKKALSALWTTRGGAFRDMKELSSAMRAATNAIQQSPTSFYPHNLLGAVLYEMGSPSKGDEHFSTAIKLGSSPREQDIQIKTALHRSTPEARRKVVEYLLAKDPIKYSWVRK